MLWQTGSFIVNSNGSLAESSQRGKEGSNVSGNVQEQSLCRCVIKPVDGSDSERARSRALTCKAGIDERAAEGEMAGRQISGVFLLPKKRVGQSVQKSPFYQKKGLFVTMMNQILGSLYQPGNL